MGKKKKAKLVKPDEYFSHGPIEMARFGKNIVSRSRLNEKQFEEFQEKLNDNYPKVVAELNTLIEEIAILVSGLPVDKILHRAWWEYAALRMKRENTDDMDTSLAIRMIDYVQSVAAAVTPKQTIAEDVTEGDWKLLSEKVRTLFRRLNSEYQICLSAKNRRSNPDHNDHLEELRFRSEIMWCNVRGRRYQSHEITALSELLCPHSEVIEELFGLKSSDLVVEFSKIAHSLTRGLGEAFEEVNKFREEFLARLDEKIASGDLPEEATKEDIFASIAQEDASMQERGSTAINRFLGMGLFDVQQITNLPAKLLDELSWALGEEKDFFAPGDFSGWPQRVWPIFKRPFLKLDAKYYCFDAYSLFDHLYRVMQRVIFKLKPEYQKKWNELQQKTSEELPFKYLRKLLPGGAEYRPVYYFWYPAKDSKKDWLEADGVFTYDDHLFIVEVKAGAFTWTSPATDLPAHIKSLQALVQNPTHQGQRFLKYLQSAPTVPIYDASHNKITDITLREFRHVTLCAITLDPFNEIAAQNQHLKKIGLDLGETPAWSISIDDLRVYAEVLDDPLTFLHFVEQRQHAIESDTLELNDELDHLGLYLKHNNYSQYASELGDKKTKIMFNGYSTAIDEFFFAKLLGDEVPNPLRQEMPFRFDEVIQLLAKSNKAGRARLSSRLLDMAGEWRNSIFNQIDEVLDESRKFGKPKPLSSFGSAKSNITIACSQPPEVRGQQEELVEQIQATMVLHHESERLFVELIYDHKRNLMGVNWQDVSLAGLSKGKIERLENMASSIKGTRIRKALAADKIGRNDPCPCGSGKKYKRCCLA